MLSGCAAVRESHRFLLFSVPCPKGLFCILTPSLSQLAGMGQGGGSCCSPSPATSPELLSPGVGLASLLAGPDRSGQGRSMLSFWERLQCQGGKAPASPRAVLTHTGM